MKRISQSIAALCFLAAATSYAAPVSDQFSLNSPTLKVTEGQPAVTSDINTALIGPSGTSRNPWGAAHIGPSGTSRNPWGA